ncbi:MAG: 4-hydroxy-3-methylbut-2-enyl diphosphate reductase [Saprospiraceae bacterium]|nr:4-hydroxy-3-methylbut-2-enyl diphosphate reductase [Saprospiraceae bacterium]
MQVTIDENSGFCFGVVYAIAMAEDELENSGQLYCLGDIVHNDMEVARLEAKGLKIINHDELHDLKDCKVLIRAHGEPPETYKLAIENNIQLIDASCPVVLKLQNRVKTAFDKSQPEDGQMVILGKPGHAEVRGLLGQTKGEAIVITSEEDLDRIDFTKPIHFYSQTTKSTALFYSLKEKIIERAAEHGNEQVDANDTICRQVSNRAPQLRNFANSHDVIVFVAGRKSSNGKVLYGVCKEENERTYFISELEELQVAWFEGANSVGICGATSTPMWLMEQTAERIQGLHVAV